ncbi:hypothetical protein LGK95_03665 [Clostridium algoriphilum]|uniref:hypothetical protein n=1 Tax=Clostridium algoriphilum TaxID=198347 RepID=UPI001CF3602F|nr:hypothetical protein [Clostridium algoriphilum]MCB2292634.1 hypothetical protein [Clostridium algoriphilum]
MKVLMEILMRRKSKLIILAVSVALLLIGTTTFVTVKYRENVKKTQQIKSEQANKITKAKRIADKVIADKAIEDKRIADKITADKVEAQRIADKKIADKVSAKVEATIIANKKISDEKLRVAKLNTGLSFDQALILGNKLVAGENCVLKLWSYNTEWINGGEFYVYEMDDYNYVDQGYDWHLAISKKSGKAFRYSVDGKLYDYHPTVTSSNTIDTTPYQAGMTLDEAKEIGNNLRGEYIDSSTQLWPVYDYTVVINGGDFYVFDIYNEFRGDDKEGAPWRLCISKASGKAFKQLQDKTLRDYK